MTIEPWNPFEKLDEFRRRSSAVFDQLLAGVNDASEGDDTIAFIPDVDVVETDREFRLYLSIPGIVEDDLLIEINHCEIVVRGQRKPAYDTEIRNAAVQEWRYGYFCRQIALPEQIRAENVRAAYDSGVLTIVLPKADSSGISGSSSGFEDRQGDNNERSE